MRFYANMFVLCVLIVLCISCSSDTDNTPVDGDAINIESEAYPDSDAGLPPENCKTPGEGPYQLKFTDVTTELGFNKEGLNVAGSVVVSGDINGDHWPDVYVSRGDKKRDDPAALKGLYRILINNGGVFSDRTWESGLFKTDDGQDGRASSYIIWGDLNNDGFTDAINVAYFDSSYETPDMTAVFLNNGDGTFRKAAPHDFFMQYLNPAAGTVLLDYDRDGKLDIFIGHHYGTYGYLESSEQDTLHQGDGAGNFTNMTEAAGLKTQKVTNETLANATSHKPTWGVTACDVDGDGWQDLMTTTYGRGYNAFYRNNQGIFENMTIASGFGIDGNNDYSDDQWFLCYCASHTDAADCAGAAKPLINCSGLENAWEPGFSDQSYRLGGNSSGTVCGDFDNDGDMDLLAVELAHWHIGKASDKTELLINDGFPAAPFKRPGREATGLAREHKTTTWDEGDLGAMTADFDNDGRLDLYVLSSDYPGTYSLLYQQQADGIFADKTAESKTKIARAHGGSFIDYDRDGDYDLIIGTSLMRWTASDIPAKPEDAWVHVLRNDSETQGNRVMIWLEGAGEPGYANRDAIGARVTVKAGGKSFIREMQGGYGLFGFEHDRLMIIGIGAACAIDSIEVQWPNNGGTSTKYTEVRANYVLKIHEKNGLEHVLLENFAKK